MVQHQRCKFEIEKNLYLNKKKAIDIFVSLKMSNNIIPKGITMVTNSCVACISFLMTWLNLECFGFLCTICFHFFNVFGEKRSDVHVLVYKRGHVVHT